jgi:2-isopropylmalate synthase
VILRRDGEAPTTEAIVKLRIDGEVEHHVAEGDGPVNALDAALRKCLARRYPRISEVHLRDYKVRVVNPTAESAAKVRAIAEFAIIDTDQDQPDDVSRYFSTVGVNENIVDASWRAISDAFAYHLLEMGLRPPAQDAQDAQAATPAATQALRPAKTSGGCNVAAGG